MKHCSRWAARHHGQLFIARGYKLSCANSFLKLQDYDDAVAASLALRDNVEAEGREVTEFQLWFTCELLSPLQHARCALIAADAKSPKLQQTGLVETRRKVQLVKTHCRRCCLCCASTE